MFKISEYLTVHLYLMNTDISADDSSLIWNNDEAKSHKPDRVTALKP